MSTNLEVTLLIADEQGNPIPHATVWGYVLPSADPLALNSDDLWRITSRYQSSFEFATRFHPVVPMLRVTPMGDAGGKAKAVIDYEAIEGYGRQRPPAMQVGFTLMKRGYFPARIDFTVKSESRLNARVVLRHDPKQGPNASPTCRSSIASATNFPTPAATRTCPGSPSIGSTAFVQRSKARPRRRYGLATGPPLHASTLACNIFQ